MTTQENSVQDLSNPSTCWYVRPDDTKSHKKNKTGPCRRWGHSSEVVENMLMVYGGIGYTTNPRHWDSVYQLDLEYWDWLKLEAVNKPPPSRDSHSCVAYKHKLFFFGGSSGEDPIGDMMEYDLDSNTWRKPDIHGQGPSPREGHSGCLFGDRYIVIFGGWNGEKTFNDCYLYDIPQNNWLSVTKTLGNQPSPREGQSVCVLQNSIYLFGGQGNTVLKDGKSCEQFFNDLHRLQIIFEGNDIIASWEVVASKGIKPLKRSSHSSCTYKDKYLFVIGGEGYPPEFDEESDLSVYKKLQKKDANEEDAEADQVCYPKNDVWYFDIETALWSQLQITNDIEFKPRFAHSCHSFKDFILVFGGLQDYNRSSNDICVLSLNGTNPFSTQLYARGRPHGGSRENHQERGFGRKNDVQSAEKSMSYIMNHFDGVEELTTNGKKPAEQENKPSISIAGSGVKNRKMTQEKFNAITPTHHIHHQVVADQKVHIEHAKTGRVLKVQPPSQERTVVSISFIKALSGTMSSPMAAFGLFVDNSMLVQAQNLNVSYVVKHQNTNSRTTYIRIEDDGIAWNHDDFSKIMLNYGGATTGDDSEKVLCEYAINLKTSGFRLGTTILFLSRKEDCVSVGFLSADKRFNPDIHKNHVFNYSWNPQTGEFYTNFPIKHKSIIFNALRGIISEDEVFNGMDRVSNRILIFDLNSVVSAGNNKRYELGWRNNDLVTKVFHEAPRELIELSLRTYLSYLFLDPTKIHLKITLNETPIKFANLWDQINKQALEHKSVDLRQIQSPVEGKFVNICGKKEGTENQGVLIYFKNRLIKRFNSSKLGALEFLSPKSHHHHQFDINGYIELKDYFEPDLFKTDIKNTLHSNYLLATVLPILELLEGSSLKRSNSQSIQEFEEINKKIKT